MQKTDAKEPILVERFLQPVVSIASSYQLMAAVNSKGEIFQWGKFLHDKDSNDDNQNEENNYNPDKIKTRDMEILIRSVECGPNHCAAISVNNELYTWGRDYSGRLGIPLSSKCIDQDVIRVVRAPKLVRSIYDMFKGN